LIYETYVEEQAPELAAAARQGLARLANSYLCEHESVSTSCAEATETGQELEERLPLPLLRLSSEGLDVDLVCSRLTLRHENVRNCQETSKLTSDTLQVHLIAVGDWLRQEMYLGIWRPGDDAVRYFALGRYEPNQGGTSLSCASSLELAKLSATQVNGQQAWEMDVLSESECSFRMDIEEYTERTERCEKKLARRKTAADFEAQVAACRLESWIDRKEYSAQTFRYLVLGPKPRLAGAYQLEGRNWRTEQAAHEKAPKVVESEQKSAVFQLDGLLWSYTWEERSRSGSLLNGPAFLFDFEEGEDTWGW
jgi:hypothetical protein